MSIAKSTTSAKPAYSKKNSRGASYKTVPSPRAANSGASAETHANGKSVGGKTAVSGIGLPKGKGAKAYTAKDAGKGSAMKEVAPRGKSDSGATGDAKLKRVKDIDVWARGGKRAPK